MQIVSRARKAREASLNRRIALFCALTLSVSGFSPQVIAAPNQLEPVLKAIDPSEAKMDTSAPAPQAQNPNPLGRINGQPVSRGNQLNRGDVNPQAPDQSEGPNYKYTPYESPDYSNSPPQFPSDSQIPEFGKPLPESTRGSAGNATGEGWTTNRTVPAPSSGPSVTSPEEIRVTRLEQQAFGSTYPEHEVDDRLDHLEKEIFGAPSTAPAPDRLARLEQKLSMKSAFGQTPSASSLAQGAIPQKTANNIYPPRVNPSAGQAMPQLKAETPQMAAAPPVPQISGGQYPSSGGQGYAGPSGNQQIAYVPPQQTAPQMGYAAPAQSFPAQAAPGFSQPPVQQPWRSGGTPASGMPQQPQASPNWQMPQQPYQQPQYQQPAPYQQPQYPAPQYQPQYSQPPYPQSYQQPYQQAPPQYGQPPQYQQAYQQPYPQPQYQQPPQPYQPPPQNQYGYPAPQYVQPPQYQQPLAPAQYPPPTQQYPAYGQPIYTSTLPQGLPSMPPPAVKAAPAASKTPPAMAPVGANPNVGQADYFVVVKGMPYDEKAGDYLSAIWRPPGISSARFSRFPLKVRLPQSSPESWRKYLDETIKKWGSYIPLKVASQNEPADIELTWENHFADNKLLGITRLQILQGHMQVRVYLLRPTFYPPDVPERILKNVAMHEIGHSIGLFGHSDNSQDVMFAGELFSARGKAALAKPGNITQRDLNTLKKIYECPPMGANVNTAKPMEWTSRL